MINFINSNFLGLWPIYPIQSQRGYLLCNWHAFNSSIVHGIYIHFFYQLQLSSATCLFFLKTTTHHQLLNKLLKFTSNPLLTFPSNKRLNIYLKAIILSIMEF